METERESDIGESDYELDEADRDLSWDEPINPEEDGGLKFSKFQDRLKWIVRLKFKQDKEMKQGNGFYVNMPHPTHHVILTAGHNLVGVKEGDLDIYPAPKNASSKPPIFYVSDAYKKDPTERQAENDYGVILVEKNPKHPHRGFGFALKLGHDALLDENVEVFGYREAESYDSESDGDGENQKEKPKWKPAASSGKCITCLPNQLMYKVKTEPGFSGSPVIKAYKDRDTAVAIHNYGPKSNDEGSKGTRLNEKVLDEIYGWLKIGYRAKALQSSINNYSPLHERLYLVFIPDSERAMVRLGYDEDLVTKFDILPAYAPPSNYGFPDDFRYVFRLSTKTGAPPEKRWVLWNASRQTVGLTSSLKGLCAVTLLEDKAPKQGEPEKKGDEKVYYVHVEMTNDRGESTELKELRMRAADLTTADLVMDSLETAEIFFERHKRGKYLFGKIPCMPGIPSKPAPEREELDFNLFRLYSG
ncbi:hypothetical protein V8C37DRAFT_415178 [Trichoderma ceciliae]